MAAALSLTILVNGEGDGQDDREVRTVPEAVRVERADQVSTLRLFARIEGLDVPLPPTPTMSPVPTEAPTSGPTVSPEPVADLVPVPLSDTEQAICAAGWPDCAKALRVARCESGPDYAAGIGIHAGTFQIAVSIHAWRFAAHGWDIYLDGADPYRNSVIAYEIWQEQGWGPWPVCGYR